MGTGTNETATFLRVCALFRDIRVEAQNAQQVFDELRDKLAALDPAQWATAPALDQARPLSEYAFANVDRFVDELDAIFHQDPVQYEWCGDSLSRIKWHILRGRQQWTRFLSAPSSSSGAHDRLDAELDEVVFHCASLTVARRLGELLENLRVGHSLDFHTWFADEVPKREQRVRILKNLSTQPEIVAGVIDVEKGLIYKASPSRARRNLSALIVLVGVVSGFGVVWLFSLAGAAWKLEGWPATEKDYPRLLVAYSFLMAGSVAHLAVSAIKQSREGTALTSALGDWLLWLHVKEAAILWSIFSLWVGFLFTVWTAGIIGWQTAFFAGYSIDSVMDVFLQRFSAAVKTANGADAQLSGAQSSGREQALVHSS